MNCQGYVHARAQPAVVELVTRYAEGMVLCRVLCLPCLHSWRASRAYFRRVGDREIREERVTWLTTLVNGEVPA